jgi:imidazolonepropionase-like amidohydrolase
MNIRKQLLATAILLVSIPSYSQNPAPAGEQTKSVLLLNGVAHQGNGNVIQNSAIGFKNGKLTLVADARVIRINPADWDTIVRIEGKHVYPGLIALNTIIGLSEIEAVRATRDYSETGTINPSSRSLTAYNTDSKVTYTVRSNGILLAQVVPQGGLISGTSSVVELDAWNWEDAAYKPDAGIHLNWPQMEVRRSRRLPSDEEQQKQSEKELQSLYKLFDDARAYASEKNHEYKNQHLESMRGLFDGSLKLFVHAQSIRQIQAAVAFAKKYGVSMVLAGGYDAWMAASLLRENKIPVVLSRIHSLPMRPDSDVQLPYKLPAMLRDSGVMFCLSNEGFWQVRNLPFQAGTAAAWGLTKEEALAAITLTPAKILGIDRLVGSLEEGKDATLIVSEGDLLDMMHSHVSLAYIRGRQIDLDNVHEQLYRKYLKKYGLD